MQIRESNFFTTQIPSQRYSLNNQQFNISQDPQNKKKHPSIRIRQAKSQAKKVARIYKQAFQEYMRVKNSVEESNNKTHKLRSQFVKLYGNKKAKYLNKSMMESKKHMDEETHLQACNRVRTIRLNNDLNLMYTKNEIEALNNKKKQDNKKLSDDLKKQLKVRRKQGFDEAREKFQAVKRGQTQFLIRKKNMSAIVSTRAHHNYLLKINQQMEMLQSYTTLLDKVNNIRELNIINKEEADEISNFNKTFFVTTKNSFSLN